MLSAPTFLLAQTEDSRRPVVFGEVPSQITVMPAHRFRVGQTVLALWSGPQVGIPLGPYVIVRLLPVEVGEPHYRVQAPSMAMSGHSSKVRSGYGRRSRRLSRLRRQSRRGGAGKGKVPGSRRPSE